MTGGKGAVVAGLLALSLSGCVSPFPPPAQDGGSETGAATESTGPAMTTDEGSTSSGMDATSDASTDETSTGDTTTSSDTGDTTGVAGCNDDEDCPGEQICGDDGTCVVSCDSWGPGNYGTCLDELGVLDTENLCGPAPDNTCISYGTPIESTHCAPQNCTTACDCPAPPGTGTATVTCGNITFPDRINDCYLSCANGETCPDGMTCRAGFVCVNDVVDLPPFGNCGNVAADCLPGGQCIVDSGHAMCVAVCRGGLAECPDPPDGAKGLICEPVFGAPPPGPECVLPCNESNDCPPGMGCVDGQRCMWPLD